MLNDMKAGLASTRKPMLSMIPRVAKTYLTRALMYGSVKYRRSNFYGDAPPGVTPALRLLAYLDATERHISRVTDALNLAIGTGGDVVAAARTADDDGGGDFPPSMLPDLAHALASLAIGVLCAVKDGLLPEDPGQPWEQHPDYAAAMARRAPVVDPIPQKRDPASETRHTSRVGAGDATKLVEWPPQAVGYTPPTKIQDSGHCSAHGVRGCGMCLP